MGLGTVYVVITEQWYGGADNYMRVFATLYLAKQYAKRLIEATNSNLDVCIYTAELDDSDTKCQPLDENIDSD